MCFVLTVQYKTIRLPNRSYHHTSNFNITKTNIILKKTNNAILRRVGLGGGGELSFTYSPVLWAWLQMLFTPKRYQDPVLWAWLQMLFTPKRYQDPVLWAWLQMLFTPKRYQNPVLWAWLQMLFTPKRYQNPVLWAWLQMLFTPKRY